MDLTAWVDVALGITIMYLGTSLFVTIINEYIAQLLNLRGRNLFHALEQLIRDKDLRATLQGVPALKPYFEDLDSTFKRLRGHSISHVDTRVLAQMLLQLIPLQSATTPLSAQQTLPQPSPPVTPSTTTIPEPGKSPSAQAREKADVPSETLQTRRLT